MSADDEGAYYKRIVGPIVLSCAAQYGVAPRQVYSRSRLKTPSTARQLAMYLSRVVLGLSYPEVGVAFGRGHTTVMSACKRVAAQRAKDPRFDTLVATLQASAARMNVPVVQPEGTSVHFPDKVWEELKKTRDSGMFGDDINEVIVRLVSLKLHEMNR